MVPSLGRGPSDFDHLSDALRAAGHRPFAIGPVFDGADLHELATEVATTVRAVENGEAVHVIGHAFGQRVVRCFASDHPHLARSVTCLCAGGKVMPTQEVLDALSRVFDTTLDDDEHLDAVATAFFAPGNDPAAWRDGWDAEVARRQTAANRATDVGDWWLAGHAPVLVVQPLQDRAAPPENGHALAADLGSRATLVTIDGAGHALLPEQPRTVADAVIEFVAGVERGA